MNRTPIVFALTRSYLVPAAVCIKSILDSSSKDDKFQIICLISETLTNEEQEQLRGLSKDQLGFSFVNMEGFSLDIEVDERFTIATYYRLLLPDLLPDYDKVLYLDCDIIIRQNLSELYKRIDISEHSLAGVYEATLDFQEEYVLSLGCEVGKYFNAGFLIMNLKKLRDDRMVPLFLKYANNEELLFNDQDVLNQLCKDSFFPLSPVYNGIRTFFIGEYRECFLKYYTQSDWDEVQKKGNIHYTGGKPWNCFTIKFDVWWKQFLSLSQDMQKGIEIKPSLKFIGYIYHTFVGKFLIDRLIQIHKSVRL